MNTVTFALSVAGALLLSAKSLPADDWPQYRGPNQDGISRETVNLAWGAAGPKVIWKTATRNGFSSFAVAGGKAFTQINRERGGEPRELVVALDAQTGQELWSGDVGLGKYDSGGDSGASSNRGGDGPRSTPMVSEGKVYVLNQDIVLFCFEADTGKPLWKKDVLTDHAGKKIGWRSGASPVADGKLLFVGGGGRGQSLLALDKNTGQVVWKTGDEKITHSTPVVTVIHGIRQVIFFVQSGLVSLATDNGRELWRFPFRFSTATAVCPVVAGEVVFCSAGYGIGGGACRVVKTGTGFKVEELWKIPGNNKVDSLWGTPVHKDGHLYGMLSAKKYAEGPLKCVELASGKVKWEQPGFGTGQVILVNNQVLALTDYGELVVVAATPQAYQEMARAKVLQGKCWSTPALAGDRIYVRSTSQGACLEVSADH